MGTSILQSFLVPGMGSEMEDESMPRDDDWMRVSTNECRGTMANGPTDLLKDVHLELDLRLRFRRLGQEIGCGQPRQPAANDGDLDCPRHGLRGK